MILEDKLPLELKDKIEVHGQTCMQFCKQMANKSKPPFVKINGKVFGEANAVLAGDALLTFAPQIIIEQSKDKLTEDTILKLTNLEDRNYKTVKEEDVFNIELINNSSNELLEQLTRIIDVNMNFVN